MGRRRKVITETQREGGVEVVRIRHPLEKKIVRVVLGLGDAALKNLAFVNAFLMDPQHVIPEAAPPELREALGGRAAAPAAAVAGDTVPIAVHKLVCQDRDTYKEKYHEQVNANRILRKQLEAAYGRKVRSGACPTLPEAAADFQKSYAARSRDRWHTSNVKSLINSFVAEFKKYGEVDALDGKEQAISDWIRKSGGASRRHWRRTYVLMFLTHAGLALDRKLVGAVSSMEIRRERAGIRWLEKSEAAVLAAYLDPYWADVFRVQVTIGLRPTELATLKRSDFSADFSELTLAAREVDGKKEFGLKTGSRTIQVPETVRSIVRSWLPQEDAAAADPVFPNPHTGLAWNRRRWFFRSYKAVLKAAAAEAEIHTPVDSRIGRRTCASILLRSTRPDGTRYGVEDVASILGDDPETIRKHYARILSAEVDPSAAAI